MITTMNNINSNSSNKYWRATTNNIQQHNNNKYFNYKRHFIYLRVWQSRAGEL